MKVVVIGPPIGHPKFPFIWKSDGGGIYMRINETQDIPLNGCNPGKTVATWELGHAYARRVNVTITNEE